VIKLIGKNTKSVLVVLLFVSLIVIFYIGIPKLNGWRLGFVCDVDLENNLVYFPSCDHSGGDLRGSYSFKDGVFVEDGLVNYYFLVKFSDGVIVNAVNVQDSFNPQ